MPKESPLSPIFANIVTTCRLPKICRRIGWQSNKQNSTPAVFYIVFLIFFAGRGFLFWEQPVHTICN